MPFTISCQMRVITGSAKGFGLKAPRHLGLRPTPSRVKEALFSSLGARILDATVLELFAGTGAFSIETLSRGARSAILVEKDVRAASLIEFNLKKTHLETSARILRTDVRQALEWLDRDHATFHVIFADPPYHNLVSTPRFRKIKKPETRPFDKLPSTRLGTGDSRTSNLKSEIQQSWMNHLLQSESLPRLLAPGGILFIEHFKKEITPESPFFKLVREFRFGDTVVGTFEHFLSK